MMHLIIKKKPSKIKIVFSGHFFIKLDFELIIKW